MNLSVNSIIGIVCSQINANMQSHMRGYSNSDTKSYPKEKDVNQDEQAFFNFSSDVLRFLYGGFPQRLLEKFFNEDEEKIVSYLRSINEEILSSNDFTKAIIENKAMIRKLCSYEFFISVGIGVSKRIKVNPSISYIPSIDDAASNIIRIGITEEQNELRYGDGIKFLNGTIDIYENGNARANTMFKLTYQAYILFGMTMGYGIYRMLVVYKQKIIRILSGVGLFVLLWTVGYFGNAVHSWFGDVWKVSEYQGLDATTFLEQDFPQDASAIRWLKQNIKGSPVVLEANGDSYTGYERVSASTGLPTVLGWYVHEWLWRNNVPDLNEKSADIQTIYTSTDTETVKKLISRYDISYIFVGEQEKEKYGTELNDSVLQSLGSIVFEDDMSGTYIVKVGQD